MDNQKGVQPYFKTSKWIGSDCNGMASCFHESPDVWTSGTTQKRGGFVDCSGRDAEKNIVVQNWGW